MQTPSFVDRMDIADDADGRVAIFTVDAAGQEPPLDALATAHRSGIHAVVDRFGAWLDASSAGVAIAAALAVVLVLGLVLLRR